MHIQITYDSHTILSGDYLTYQQFLIDKASAFSGLRFNVGYLSASLIEVKLNGRAVTFSQITQHSFDLPHVPVVQVESTNDCFEATSTNKQINEYAI